MNTNHIILSGGGDPEVSSGVDQKYFSLLKNNAKILYIPIALTRSKIGFEACYDWFSTLVSKHPQGKDIDFTMLLEDDKIPDLDAFDSIYVGGGNTYKLLNYIISSGLDKKITDFIQKRGIYYGGSAGAIIMGKDIRTAEEENDKNYLHFEGLNLLEGKSIVCHYVEALDQKIFTIAKKLKSEIIAIPEDSGIFLNNDITEVVGEIFIFDEKTKKRK